MSRLTISMPDQMNEWVEAQINAGRYGNVSEYFRDLVRRDQERREAAIGELRAMLDRAEASGISERSVGVNGRAKVSQRAAQNVATLGLARLPHRRAPASGRPRLSQSWRLPGCFGPQGPTGVHIGVGLRLVLAGFALAQAIALAVHLKDVHMMGQTIQ